MKPFQTYSHMVQLGIQCTVLLHELLKNYEKTWCQVLTSHMLIMLALPSKFISSKGIFCPRKGPNIARFSILSLANTPIWPKQRLLGRLSLQVDWVPCVTWRSSIHSNGPWSGQSPNMQDLLQSPQTKIKQQTVFLSLLAYNSHISLPALLSTDPVCNKRRGQTCRLAGKRGKHHCEML